MTAVKLRDTKSPLPSFVEVCPLRQTHMRKDLIFKMHDRIILVPQWIDDELQRNGAGLNAIVNFPAMRTIFSMSDLFQFLATQKFGELVFCTKDVVSDCLGVLCDWNQSCLDKADREYISKNIEPYVSDPFHVDAVRARLFRHDDAVGFDESPPYRVVPIEDTHLAVVIRPNAFDPGNAHKYSASLVQAVLKQLYVYEEELQVARTALMRRHLTNLSKQ